MPLIVCDECGAETNDDVTTCPRCKNTLHAMAPAAIDEHVQPASTQWSRRTTRSVIFGLAILGFAGTSVIALNFEQPSAASRADQIAFGRVETARAAGAAAPQLANSTRSQSEQ